MVFCRKCGGIGKIKINHLGVNNTNHSLWVDCEKCHGVGVNLDLLKTETATEQAVNTNQHYQPSYYKP